MIRQFLLLAILWLTLPTHILASEILAAEVTNEGDVYQVHLKVRISAPYDFVYQHLTDYANIKNISQNISTSTILKREPPHFQIRLVSEGCIWFVCRTVIQVQDVYELGNGLIKITVIPEQSDLRQNQSYWQIKTDGLEAGKETTMVSYSAKIEPDFWIPPLIGTGLFKERLLQEGQYILNTIEQHATQLRQHDQ